MKTHDDPFAWDLSEEPDDLRPVLDLERDLERELSDEVLLGIDAPDAGDTGRPDESAPERAEVPGVGITPPQSSAVQPAPPGPVRPMRARRGMGLRAFHFWGLLLVAAIVGAVAPRVVVVERDADGSMAPSPPPRQQAVVVWTVVDEGKAGPFVAVLAAGVRPPVILALPPEVTLTLPGQGVGTLGEAAEAGDPGYTTLVVENLLGVPAEGSVATSLEDLSTAADALGGLTVAERALDGAGVARYLSAHLKPEEAFQRWQDVIEGLLAAAAERPRGVDALPVDIRSLVRASAARPDVIALPVEDVGAGLLRPDQEAVEAMVAERFVEASAGPDEVRIVVLNGVGTPGVGEEVARILVPEGYVLVASYNANTFNVRVTKIVASSNRDLPAARKARRLLGTGRVLLDNQPGGLADVTVVVGEDLGGR